MRHISYMVALLLTTGAAHAQDEATLRHYFEGKSVTLKMDMPATVSGVVVRPHSEPPVDMPSVGASLKENGTAIRRGEQSMITKVHVRGDHIEFQLGGGGYGTFGDLMSESSTGTGGVSQGKSKREKDLEHELKSTTDPQTRKYIQEELDDLKRQRERDNAQAQRDAAQTAEMHKTDVESVRLRSGSRFNIKYKDRVPPEALTPDGVKQALARYVDFSGEDFADAGARVAAQGYAPKPDDAPAASGIGGLRKGLTVVEVEKLLGPATAVSDEKDGSMEVNQRTYKAEGQVVVAKFVSGVLVDYSVKPGS